MNSWLTPVLPNPIMKVVGMVKNPRVKQRWSSVLWRSVRRIHGLPRIQRTAPLAGAPRTPSRIKRPTPTEAKISLAWSSAPANTSCLESALSSGMSRRSPSELKRGRSTPSVCSSATRSHSETACADAGRDSLNRKLATALAQCCSHPDGLLTPK